MEQSLWPLPTSQDYSDSASGFASSWCLIPALLLIVQVTLASFRLRQHHLRKEALNLNFLGSQIL